MHFGNCFSKGILLLLLYPHRREMICFPFAQISLTIWYRMGFSPQNVSILSIWWYGCPHTGFFLHLWQVINPIKLKLTSIGGFHEPDWVHSLCRMTSQKAGSLPLKLLILYLPENTLCLCFQCIFFPIRK